MAESSSEEEPPVENPPRQEAPALPRTAAAAAAAASAAAAAATAVAATLAPAQPGSPTGVTRLGLHFRGGPQGSGPPGGSPLTWREGKFSDYKVKVGDRTYELHAFLLARSSQFFFDRHIHTATASNEAAERGADLTEVLPASCHSAFEDMLDFIYSENQSGFEAPASKALLLLKIADILGIAALFSAMSQRIDAAFAETAPILLEQYCGFHIPGTDDGAALSRIREAAVELVVRKFQPFLARPEMRKAVLRLPSAILAEILECEELRVAAEDVVFDFLVARFEEAPQLDAEGAVAKASPGSCCEEDDALWQRVRWQYLSAAKFAEALSLSPRLLRPEMALHALATRLAHLDVGANEALLLGGPKLSLPPPRQPILPAGMPPPGSTEVDFYFHYTHPEQFACGEAIRSQPKQIGDLVLRVLVFPSGTDTGVARGSLSVFLEAVPQTHWPSDWEFVNIRYSIQCVRWPSWHGETWAAKRKSVLWTFKPSRLDRGWHDFLAPGEVQRYLGPDGFVCIRGSLDAECLGRTFLLTSQAAQAGSYPGPEAAGSSASRRPWARTTLTMSPAAEARD